jgi:hypothetical protein
VNRLNKKHSQKGGKKMMKYKKPDVIPLGTAAAAIQSSTAKKTPNMPDGANLPATTAAYEADE